MRACFGQSTMLRFEGVEPGWVVDVEPQHPGAPPRGHGYVRVWPALPPHMNLSWVCGGVNMPSPGQRFLAAGLAREDGFPVPRHCERGFEERGRRGVGVECHQHTP